MPISIVGINTFEKIAVLHIKSIVDVDDELVKNIVFSKFQVQKWCLPKHTNTNKVDKRGCKGHKDQNLQYNKKV